MSIGGSNSFPSVQECEISTCFGASDECAQYGILNAFLKFDITLKAFATASVETIRELPSRKEVRVHFKHPNTRFCLDISTRDGMPLRCCTLYENEVIRLQWSLMNGVRSGHFFFYADGILQYEGFWENPAILLENSKRGVVMIQLSLLSQHIIYRGGFHPTSYKRDGWSCEYSEETGEPKRCVWYKNGELKWVEKEFDVGTMIEYLDKKRVVYIGEYKNDYALHYPRHGFGVQVNPENGMEMWNGEWRDGRMWEASQCDNKEWFAFTEENELNYGFHFTEAQSVYGLQGLQSRQSLQHITTLVFDDGCGCDQRFKTLDLCFYPFLKKVSFGSRCFPFVSSFLCCGMAHLKSVRIGHSCFFHGFESMPFARSGHGCVFRDCPVLVSLVIGVHSFATYHHCLLESAPVLCQ